jgi:hypothetical protein
MKYTTCYLFYASLLITATEHSCYQQKTLSKFSQKYAFHYEQINIPGTGGYSLPHLFVMRDLHAAISESISWKRLHTKLNEQVINLASKYEQM